MEIGWTELAVFLLVMSRMTSFMVASPFFSIKSVPPLTKIGAGVVLSFIIFPLVRETSLEISNTAYFIFQVARETLVGLALGYTASLVFNSIRLAGRFIDMSMGFYMVSVLDPVTGENTSLVGQYLYLLGILLFFIIDGHHSLLAAIYKSYELIPLASAVLSGPAVQNIISIFSGMFALAFRIALPVVAVLLITDICLGLVARTVPQLNVFILGFPLKAALGLVALGILAPILATVASGVYQQMERDLMTIIKALG